MSLDMKRAAGASLLAGAGAVWPSTLCAITDAAKTPYQRALDAAWCGAGQAQFEVLGHCPACWAGAAAFLIAALAVLGVNRTTQRVLA
jgi:hypothetical protein